MSFNLMMMIVSRAVQSIGAAFIMGNVMGIVANIFLKGNRGKALGMIGAVVAAGTIIGPSLGGFLIDQFGWRSIFLINVPLGIISIIGAGLLLPPLVSEKKQKVTYDLNGALMFFLAMTTLLFFITNAQTMGWNSKAGLIILSVSIISWILFVFIEQKAEQPMIDLAFFKNPQFTIGMAGLFIYYYLMLSTYVLLPLYFHNALELPVLHIGLLMTPQALVMIVASPLSGWLADRIGTLIPSLIGMSIITFDLFLMSRFSSLTSYADIIVTMAILGLGFAMFASPNNVAVIESLPASQSGIAGSLIATVRNFGQVTGTAVGILLLNLSLIKFENDYAEAISFVFTISIIIGIATLFILSLNFKSKARTVGKVSKYS